MKGKMDKAIMSPYEICHPEIVIFQKINPGIVYGFCYRSLMGINVCLKNAEA